MALTPIIDVPELTVHGPPDKIEIVSDIGARGERGSKIFSNIGDPDGYTVAVGGSYSMNGESLKIGDLYQRVDNNSFYQWVQLPTGPVWQSRSGFNNYFRVSMPVTFVDCEASIEVPLTDLWTDTGVADILSSNICVTLTVISTEKAFVTIVSKSLDASMPRKLLLDLFGYKIVTGSLVTSALNEEVEVNIAISLIV